MEPTKKIEETEVKKTAPTPTIPKEEATMKVSDVKKLIAEAIANSKNETPTKLKRVLEHNPHVWRLDGKWVVDFTDRNTDPYVKKPIHSYQIFNDKTREFESWIELVFHDGTKKEIYLKNYVQNRTPIYCTVVSKEKIDKSYSIGEVEKKKEWGDSGRATGTGVIIDQTVEMYQEIFTIKTPDGEVLKVPDYALC